MDQKAHYPKLMIPECNAPKKSERPDWFRAVAKRMHTYGAHSIGVLTFWNGPGNLGGPWDPKDTKTINAMKDIIQHIF